MLFSQTLWWAHHCDDATKHFGDSMKHCDISVQDCHVSVQHRDFTTDLGNVAVMSQYNIMIAQ